MGILTTVIVIAAALLIFSLFIEGVSQTPVVNVIAGLLLIAFTGLYMLPTGIHIIRGLPQAASKFWINFLLGWTIIVWIWGLITACLTDAASN